ncbi:NLI interacting factor-like phosphatase, putative [Trypanosoma equiperdum]|uniref:FCP1 homology domain-containing protein n=2 Tax=Trypanozoon TaxID=39700 RepID=Q388H5_TRYB2|nr:hypothetical protein, conserved [Trypanosoma brucei brucei TREU927]EAN78795.1 hypothetical protein, conserved [Trypanosoma brucei brucei TREU927]SCU66527.1 NLI interacting factor-like phosphatase, putative [Trypanosoma equiperdum]
MRRSGFVAPPDNPQYGKMETRDYEEWGSPHDSSVRAHQQSPLRLARAYSVPYPGLSTTWGMGGSSGISTTSCGKVKHNVHHQKYRHSPYGTSFNIFSALPSTLVPAVAGRRSDIHPSVDKQDVAARAVGNIPPHRAYRSASVGCFEELSKPDTPTDTPSQSSPALTSCWLSPWSRFGGRDGQLDVECGTVYPSTQNSSPVSCGGAVAAFGGMTSVLTRKSSRQPTQVLHPSPKKELDQLIPDGLTPSSNESDTNSAPSSQSRHTKNQTTFSGSAKNHDRPSGHGGLSDCWSTIQPPNITDSGEGEIYVPETTQPVASSVAPPDRPVGQLLRDLLSYLEVDRGFTTSRCVGAEEPHCNHRRQEHMEDCAPQRCASASPELHVPDVQAAPHHSGYFSPVRQGSVDRGKVTQYLLPEQRSEHVGRTTCCLDLDDTLVHTFERRPSWWNPAENSFHLEIELNIPTSADQVGTYAAASAGCGSEGYEPDKACASTPSQPSSPQLVNRKAQLSPMCSARSRLQQRLYVCIRPFAKELLEYCFETFEVVFFTTGTEEYATSIFDHLDPHHKAHRLYRHHCTAVGDTYKKDLSLLGRPLDRVILLDDRGPEVSFQPNNVLFCDPFIIEEMDDALQRTQGDDVLSSFLKLLRTLATLPPYLMLQAMRDYQDAVARVWEEDVPSPPE